MTKGKNFKRRVRTRMNETGEPYTEAYAALEAASNDPGKYATLGMTTDDVGAFRRSMPPISIEEIANLWVLGVRPDRFAAYHQLGFNPGVMQVAAVVNISPVEAAELIEMLAPDEVRQGIDYAAIGLRPRHLRAYRDAMPELSLTDSANLFTMGVRPDHFAESIARGMTVAEMLDEAAVGPRETGLEDVELLEADGLPVDDGLTPEQYKVLKGVDRDLLAQIPVDGPFSPEQLTRLVGRGLAETVALVRQLPLDGPLDPSDLDRFAEVGHARILDAIRHARFEGPLSPGEIVRLVEN